MSAAAAAAAIGSAGSNILTSYANTLGALATTWWDYKLQKQQIKEQNEYNSPASQMARYQAAGLNPQLIYGQGQSSAGNQMNVANPNFSRVPFDFSGVFDSAMNSFLSVLSAQKEIEMKDSQIANYEVQNSLLQEEWASKSLDNTMKAYLMGLDTYASGHQDSYDKIVTSPAFRQKVNEADISEFQKLYWQANATFQSLRSDEQEYINRVIQPLQAMYFDLRNKGMTEDNAMKKIRADLNRDLASIGGEQGASMIWKVISMFLRMFTIMGSSHY